MLKKDGTMYLEIPNSNITEKIINIINKRTNIANEIFKDFEDIAWHIKDCLVRDKWVSIHSISGRGSMLIKFQHAS